MLEARKFTLWSLLIFLLAFGCSQQKKPSPWPDINTEEEAGKWLPSLLDKTLPASRYLSNQDRENLRPVGEAKGGYDPNYQMLAFRRLEGITDRNPPAGNPMHIEGVRLNAFVIRWIRRELTSKQLINLILGKDFLKDPAAHFQETMARIEAQRRKALAEHGDGPVVAVAGLGPVGLLAALEAYLYGASVIAIEQRAQYTRPQILRLSTDTIDRIKYFLGERFWDYLKNYRGIVSKSPNWAPNKFDLTNEFIYPGKGKEQALAELSANERAERNRYIDRGYDVEDIEIVRINHLETLLAAVLEELAKADPEHLRIYYGGELKVKTNNGSADFSVDLSSSNVKSNFPIHADIVAISEGAGSNTTAADLGFKTETVSKKLYGSTIALRLPQGFDIGLRPIENRDGTASVKGIAIIDKDKLTDGQPIVERGKQYSWTMVEENELCKELNLVLQETAQVTKTANPSDGVLLPCDISAANLPEPWKKRNGGQNYFLPRTRYFFTGGIAYLGAELSEQQLSMFEKRKTSNDPAIKNAANIGLKTFLLYLAKKHMPREYVEGQGNRGSIAHESLGNDSFAADNTRVIMPAEEAYSLTTFPIELKKGEKFTSMFKSKNDKGETHPVRVVTLGDNYATTHFFTGTGAVNGLRAAMAFGDALKNGAKSKDFKKAAADVLEKTDAMHRRVMYGESNAPLDGPFNPPL